MRVIFALADAGACELVTSGYAMEEARRNILAKRPKRADDLGMLLGRVSMCPEPAPAALAWAATQRLPPKDAPILAAAVESRCHLLVTGDRSHFGALFGRRFQGTVVMLPVDAIELLVG